MYKNLRKATMKRSQLKTKYYKINTLENLKSYKKQKNFCSKLYKKERKKYNNLELSNIIETKIFWKTIKPFLSDQGTGLSKITLINKEKVISVDQQHFVTFSKTY